MKITPIKGIFALFIGWFVLRFFFPWWFVTIVIGGATCFAIYKWVIIRTNVNPLWAKRFMTVAVIIFSISLFTSFVEKKWPWIAKALDSRQLVISLGVEDWLNPKHPVDLEMKLRKL